jgi:molybdopterin synthase catalytic subunit
MQFDVRLFATLKDRAGTDRVRVEVPDEAVTISNLLSLLSQAAPTLGPFLPTAIASVNYEFSFSDQILKAGDEVALFPPVSGG